MMLDVNPFTRACTIRAMQVLVVVLLLATRAPEARAQHAVSAWRDARATRRVDLPSDGGTASWLRWGLVGAAAGAVTFPLLSTLGSSTERSAARDVVAGAAIGFVVVGGSVALWQAVCGPDSASRRAGLCGGR